MYIKHCKLSRNKQLELMKYFVAGSTARIVADLVGIHRNTSIRFFHKLREKIALKQAQRSEQFSGEVGSQRKAWSRCSRKSSCVWDIKTWR